MPDPHSLVGAARVRKLMTRRLHSGLESLETLNDPSVGMTGGRGERRGHGSWAGGEDRSHHRG
jgi:hypothetical protein